MYFIHNEFYVVQTEPKENAPSPDAPEDSVIGMIRENPAEYPSENMHTPYRPYPNEGRQDNYYHRQNKGGYRPQNRNNNRNRPHYGEPNEMQNGQRRPNGRPNKQGDQHYRNGRYNPNSPSQGKNYMRYNKDESMEDLHRGPSHNRRMGATHGY